MRASFARGSSRPTAFEYSTESQPWAQRHAACTELRALIFRICSEQSLQDAFGTRHEPLLTHTQLAQPTYTYVCMAGKGVGERDTGGVTVPLNAGDHIGAHTHHLASALYIRTPHFA